MREQLSRILPLILIIVIGFLLFNTFSSFFSDEEPSTEATAEPAATATPYVPPETAVVSTDQGSGVTLKKIAGSETVPLGQVVS